MQSNFPVPISISLPQLIAFAIKLDYHTPPLIVGCRYVYTAKLPGHDTEYR